MAAVAHYDIFRDQLAVKYPGYGHALWEPSPGRLYSAVEVGDVGFIREGRFNRLFNALLPADDPSHQNLGVPAHYEPLTTPGVAEHIDHHTLGSQDFCSGGVRKSSSTESEVFAAAPPDPGQLSFSCTKKQGAVLCLPVQAQREDTITRGVFRDYIVRHIDNWVAFARWLGLGIDQMEDIILVTGRDLTRSCTNVAFSETEDQAGARVSFGVEVSDGIGIRWNFAREHVSGAVLNPGRSGRDLLEDQCIFIRGWRVTRTLMVLRRLRGASGPSDLGGYDPESGTQTVFEPNVPKYRDPLHGLLEYLAETTQQAPECAMVLVHDDDLGFIKGIGDSDGTPLETLDADVVKGHLRSMKPEIQQVLCDWSPSNESSPNADTTTIRVAMLSNGSQGNLGSPGLVTEPSPTTAPRTPSTDDASKSLTIFLQLSPRSPCMAASPTYPAPEHQGESGSPQSHLTRPTYSEQPSPDYPPRTPLLENNSVGSLVQDQQAESQPVLQGTTSSLGVQLQSVTTISENTGAPISDRLTPPAVIPQALLFITQCNLPDCINPAFFDPDIQEQRDYCQEHVSFAVSSGFAAPCQQCGIMPARFDSTFCSKACDDAHLRLRALYRQSAARNRPTRYCEECRSSLTKPGMTFCSEACAHANTSNRMVPSTVLNDIW